MPVCQVLLRKPLFNMFTAGEYRKSQDRQQGGLLTMIPQLSLSDHLASFLRITLVGLILRLLASVKTPVEAQGHPYCVAYSKGISRAPDWTSGQVFVSTARYSENREVQFYAT